jgi:hypothetical protein
VFSSDVAVAANGGVTVNRTHALTSDSSSTVWIYGDDLKGFSLYFGAYAGASHPFEALNPWHTNVDSKTGKFFGSVGEGAMLYQAGMWTLKRCYSPTSGGYTMESLNTPIPELYALFRTQGPRYKREEMRKLITDAATAWSIPPHIAYGVAYEESSFLHRWQHFSANSANPASGYWTCVTPDGGIGLMQLTTFTALEDEVTRELAKGQEALDRIGRLGSDVMFNLEAGMATLDDKWEQKSVGNNDRTILEDWFYAVWHYNGYRGRGFEVYPTSVFEHIDEGYYWNPVELSFPDEADEAKLRRIDYTPAPAHVDVGFTGGTPVEVPAELKVGLEHAPSQPGILTYNWKVTNTSSKVVQGHEVRLILGGVSLSKVKIVTTSGTALEKQLSTTPKVLNPLDVASFQTTFLTSESVSAAECEVKYFDLGLLKCAVRPPKGSSMLLVSKPGSQVGLQSMVASEAFSLSPSAVDLVAGDARTFSASITNLSSQPLYINQVSVNTGKEGIRFNELRLLADSPAFLNAHEGWDRGILEMEVDSNTPDGDYVASIAVYGGSSATSSDLIGKQELYIQVGFPTGGEVILAIGRTAIGSCDLRWTGGFPPYQVQKCVSLTSGVWTNWGASVVEGKLSIPVAEADAFFRVLYQESE